MATKNYASFGRRFVAVLIDGLILGVINFALMAAFGSPDNPQVGIPTLLSIAISWGYYIYFIGSRGQTPGKMAMKIKVVKLDTGKTPSYLEAFVREIVGKFISGLVLLLGYLWMLWDAKKQTWHDKIAQTEVIKIG